MVHEFQLRRLFPLLALFILAFALPLSAQEEKRRIALVIGNSAYENVPALSNPGNDAADLAAALQKVGFEVILHSDQSQASMLDSLRTYRRKAAGAEIALIYFAGHGIEIDRQNYLIPVDAVLETDSDINFEAVPLDTVIFAASGATRLSMVIVDACRNNPFATSIKRTSSSRSIGRGLTAVEPTRNTLVAYAAKEGTTAADGSGRNSPYAEALIEALKEPNLEVGLMMRRVRDGVLQATAGEQEPFVYGSLSADQIFLNDTRGISIAEPEPEPETPVVSPADARANAVAAEVAFWQSIYESSKPEELRAYLKRYPDGLFVDLARSRLESQDDDGDEGEDLASLAPVEPLEPEAPPEPPRALRRSEVVELQERLSALGHSLGRADGIAGRRTQNAIRDFEASENMAITGQATLPVLTALRASVSDATLADWRARQATVRTTTPKPSAPTTSQPKTPTTTTPPKEAEASTGPDPEFRQFCNSNRQCGTSQCRQGGSGDFFKKTQACQFCRVWARRCQ